MRIFFEIIVLLSVYVFIQNARFIKNPLDMRTSLNHLSFMNSVKFQIILEYYYSFSSTAPASGPFQRGTL